MDSEPTLDISLRCVRNIRRYLENLYPSKLYSFKHLLIVSLSGLLWCMVEVFPKSHKGFLPRISCDIPLMVLFIHTAYLKSISCVSGLICSIPAPLIIPGWYFTCSFSFLSNAMCVTTCPLVVVVSIP